MLAATDILRLLSWLFSNETLVDYGMVIWPLLMLVVAAVILLCVICPYALIAVWLERKVSARMQCRVGPTEVGPLGLLQTLTDGLKLMLKEDLIPDQADKILFIMGPVLVFAGTFAAFLVVPFGPDLIPADLNLGVVYLAAIGSIEAFGVILAGWGSNNKWALFGAVRTATQVVSYEIPLGICLLAIVAVAGSFSIQDIVWAQEGLFLNWFVFRNPFLLLLFPILYIANLAECKRAPFDLPEAESELVAGFHTEYSAMRFSMFFLAEYAAMYLVSALAAVTFLGGWWWGIPGIDGLIADGGVIGNVLGAVAVVGKSLFLVFVQMWLRWTLPRLRLDQMMHLCLKVLLPISLFCMVGAVVCEYFRPDTFWLLISTDMLNFN